MRVLAAVVAPPHLTDSGAVRAGTELSVALAEEGCEMTIALMAKSEGQETLGKALVVSQRCHNWLGFTEGVLPPRYRTLLYRADAEALIGRGDFQLVHIHNLMPALQMRRVARASRARGIPYVVSTHGLIEATKGLEVYGFSSLPQRLAWRHLVERPLHQVMRGADMVLALSPADESALRVLGVPDRAIRVVPNAVPETFLRDVPPAEKSALLQRLGLGHLDAPEVPVCLFLANHAKNKGIDVLLQAFDRCRDPYLLIVAGQRRDNVDYSMWEGRRGPDQNVAFPGSLPLADVQALYARSDLFVFPTLADTYPLVILEAMVYGCPIVSTEVGGIPFQVDGACAELVPPGDVGALAAVLSRLLPDAEHRRRMGRAAMRTGRRHLGWGSAARLALQGYGQVLSDRGPGSPAGPRSGTGHRPRRPSPPGRPRPGPAGGRE